MSYKRSEEVSRKELWHKLAITQANEQKKGLQYTTYSYMLDAFIL